MSTAIYDAIIITGEGFNADESLAGITKVRLDEAAKIYMQGDAGAILICGLYGYKVVDKPDKSEAKIYGDYLQTRGVPEQVIYLEEESQETLGNILFAKMNILMRQGWHKLLVMPSYNHSTERITYLLHKVLGPEYEWRILRVVENDDPVVLAREAKSLQYTKQINDAFEDGDHEAIYEGLKRTHPAYGGTMWTIDELRQKLGS